MIKRTIEISRDPMHLMVRDGQLLILRKDEAEARRRVPANPPNLAASIPCEDLGMVMVDNRETTFSASALSQLAEHGAAVAVCGPNHLPIGLLLPLSDRHETVWRIKEQIAASRPRRKNIWKVIVQAKIRAQARNLPENTSARAKLFELRSEVQSGDPTNVEAQAAKIYWGAWLSTDGASDQGKGFRRVLKDDGPPPNNLLNYGYAVLRAAVARAIVSAGLLPAIGIHHDSRSNPFCLADDLMEPLRPMADRIARRLYLHGQDQLLPPAKKELLGLLTCPVRLGKGEEAAIGPLMVALPRYVASFIACLADRKSRLLVPVSAEPSPRASGGRSRAEKREKLENDLFDALEEVGDQEAGGFDR